jgi:uncharacterized protein (DUF1800 family)
MDRRTTLSLFLGINKENVDQKDISGEMEALARPIGGGLEPYSGPWTKTQAAHLLRRTTFGPTLADIRLSETIGLQQTLQTLFVEYPMPAGPLNLVYANDSQVPIGQTWVDKPFSATDAGVLNYRNLSLRAWLYDLLLQDGMSIREKLTLFWHNHFATNEVVEPNFQYHHLNLLRTFAWGNFKELVKRMTVDPLMLRFLNGNQNTRNGKNENYARELLELFTIGKGPLAGPGDYTFYTEKDVSEIARALTGWRDAGYRFTNPTVRPGSFFTASLHDTGTKTLSPRFGNATIPNQNENEYKTVVDLIFREAEVARFICRKLYRWFVYYQISTDTERDVIEPMAQILRDNNYEIKPALLALLSSKHFFDAPNVGPMIKNPVDFTLGLLRQTQTAMPTSASLKYNVLTTLFRTVALQQMEYLNPPDVAGWKAYYQEPAYYRIWINATTLGERMKFSDRFALEGHRYNNFLIRLDPLGLIKKLENPEEADSLIAELAQLLLPQPLTEAQVKDLKEVLIPGLPDYEWTIEYNLHLNRPNDTALKNAVESKLRSLFKAMFSMAEFYLS